MKYMGSKRRIAKHILPIILKDRTPGQWYVEPFVGGANMIDKVDGLRIGADKNDYLVSMWRALVKGWTPPDYVDEETHADVKKNPDKYPPYFVAFVRLGCSFGADWNGGFARNVKKDAPDADILNRTIKSYCKQSKNNILKQLPNLQDVYFEKESFSDLYIPEKSIIYCDPPYKNTTGYKDGFDHDVFWDWVRAKSQEGHRVFVSEYSAPEDFVCIWKGEVKTNISTSFEATEKLFVFNDLY